MWAKKPSYCLFMLLARRWEDECRYDEVFSRKFGPAGALVLGAGAYIGPIHK